MTENSSKSKKPDMDSTIDNDIENLKEAIDKEKAESEKNLIGWKRTQADLENLKKRFEQEKTDIITYGNTSLLKKMLPIIDDMDRAFSSVPEDIAGNPWVKGIELVRQNIDNMLKSEHIQVIETVGKQFDPKFHDAFCQENGPEGIIVTEIEKGYTYKGEVLRAAKVTVGNGASDSELQCNDN